MDTTAWAVLTLLVLIFGTVAYDRYHDSGSSHNDSHTPQQCYPS